MEEDFFVGIQEPKEVRRNILETSKEIIIALKQHENYDNIRAEKLKQVEELKKILNELSNLMNELKEKLPEVKTIKTVSIKEPIKPKKLIKTSREVNKLERELTEVEEKLKEL